MEQSRIAFTTMLGSAQKANDFLQKMAAFAAKTPFEFQDVTRASQRLMAMGIKAQDVVPYLTAIGDAVAGLGGGADQIDQVTTAIGQMAAKGKIQSDEILQLTEAGIPALKILADSYHVSTGQMQDMITKGNVLSDDALPKLIKGLETGTKSTQGFGGMMDQQSKSLSGMWSTLKDTVTMGLGQAVQPILPILEDAMGKATPVLQSMFKGIDTGFQASVSWLQNTGVPGIKGVFALIGQGDFTSNLRKAFNIEEDNPVVGFILDARQKIIHIWDGIGNLWNGLDWSGLGKAVEDQLKTVGGSLVSGITTGIKTGNWAPLGTALVGAIQTGLKDLVKLAGQITSTLGDLMAKVDWMTIAIDIGKQIPTFLIGIVTGILNMDWGQLFMSLLSHWKEILFGLLTLAFLPESWIGKIGELLAKIPFIGKLLEWLLSHIADFAKGAKDFIGKIAKSFFDEFGKAFTGAGQLAGIFERLWINISTRLGVWILDLIKWFKDLPGNIIKGAGDLGGEIGGWFDQIGRRMVQAVSDAANTVVGWFRQLGSWLGGIAQSIWSWVTAPFVRLGTDLANIAGNIWTWVRGKFASLATDISNIAGQAWQWVVSKFQGLATDISNIAGNAWSWVRGKFAALGQDIANLAGQAWQWVSGKFQALASDLSRIAGDIWSWVTGKFRQIGTDLSNIAGSIWQWVVDKFNGMKTAVSGIFQDIANAVGRIWNDILNIVKAPVRIVLGFINDDIIGLLNKVTSVFGLNIPKIPINFATGGIVPGGYSPGVDNMVAMVGSGEAIMRPEWTRAVGADWIYAANAAAKSGGVQGVRQFIGQSGMPAYADGGIAGFFGGIGSAIGGAASGAWDWTTSKVENLIGQGVGFALNHIISPAADWVTGHIGNEFVQKSVSNTLKQMATEAQHWGDKKQQQAAAPGPGSGASKWTATVLQVLGMLGVPASALNGVLNIIGHESGGNPTAINLTDSNARAGHPSQGLMQTIPSTFAAYAGPYAGLGITNPLANIYAGVNYALHRYGVGWLTSGGNRTAGGSYAGYKDGGIIPGRLPIFDTGGILQSGALALNKSGAPERVLSPSQTKTFEEMLQNGGTGNGNALIGGDLVLQLAPDASVKDQMDEALFQLRRIRRGGLYA